MSLAGAGAGAAEGLDTFLTRMMQEQQLERLREQQAEAMRHNRATEGISLRGQDLNEQLRQDTNDRLTTNATVAHADTRGIGDVVKPEEMARETAAGIPSSRYGVLKGLKAIQTSGGAPLIGDTSTAPALKTEQTQGADSIVNQGTEAQQLARLKEANDQKPKAGGGYNMEQKTGKLGGKPIDYWADPRDPTKRFTADGTPIPADAKIEHYEKPPAPDRVLVQSGDGYIRRADAAEALAKGGEVPLAETSATRTMAEGARMIRPHVTELKDMATALDKRGLFGPVMSRVRQVAAKYGTALDDSNPDVSARAMQQAGNEIARAISSDPALNNDELVGQFAASLGLMATGAGRVHGGARGGGSPQMLQHFKELLSDNGTLSMFRGRLSALDSYMKTYEGGSHVGESQPATDPYQEYLNSLKKK